MDKVIDQLEDFLQSAVIRWCESLREDLDEGELEENSFEELLSRAISNADLILS